MGFASRGIRGLLCLGFAVLGLEAFAATSVIDITYDDAGNVSKIERRASSAVTVVSFSPSSGPTGTAVTITGSGFSAVAANNAVTFNGTGASVSSATATSIVATVPAGAMTGPISVTVATVSGTSAGSFVIPCSTNHAPTVAISAPASAVSITAGSSIALNATAADADGDLAKVEFWADATKLGESTASPYTFNWSGVAAGLYSVTAKAIDSCGASTTSIARYVNAWANFGMVNGTFESPTVSGLASGTVPTAWTAAGTTSMATSTYLTGASLPSAPDGLQVAGISPATGSLSQVVYLDAGWVSISGMFGLGTSGTQAKARISVNGVQQVEQLLTGTAYQRVATPAFPVTRSGLYTIKLHGATVSGSPTVYADSLLASRANASSFGGDVMVSRPDGAVELWGVATDGTLASRVRIIDPGSGWTPRFTGDFDGDGSTDILWQHTDGRTALWLMKGRVPATITTLLDAGTGWTAKAVADFNGDGTSDILWEHTDGRSALWIMQGGAQNGPASALLLPAGSGWTATLAADFDGDGKADIVWTHADGRVALWGMNGASQIAANSGYLLSSGGTGWRAILAPDLDGNGKADLVWERSDAGGTYSTAVWLMSGWTQVGGAMLATGATGDRRVTGIGDFNGDGKVDLLWRTTSGATRVGIMNGASTTETEILSSTYSYWTAVRVQHLNGDGKSDLIWVRSNGDISDWFMSGAAIGSPPGGYLMTGNTDSWAPVALPH